MALVSDGSGPIPALGTVIGVLPRWQTVAILTVLAAISLRDKVIFLAARAEVYGPLALAFRGMNTHGRALYTLVHRALAGYDEDDYNLCEGEVLCSMVLGWNFGDGHMHNECLIEALQQRCGFAPGDVRVVVLDAQPIHQQRQEYRLVDAATGEFERGYIEVDDMVTTQPWADDLPVHVQRAAADSA